MPGQFQRKELNNKNRGIIIITRLTSPNENVRCHATRKFRIFAPASRRRPAVRWPSLPADTRGDVTRVTLLAVEPVRSRRLAGEPDLLADKRVVYLARAFLCLAALLPAAPHGLFRLHHFRALADRLGITSCSDDSAQPAASDV